VQYEQATRECVDAVVAAVHDGVLTPARLQDAGRRVQQLATKFAAPVGGVLDAEEERQAGLSAARRATSTEGEVRGLGELVVVLDDRTSIAAGPVPWGPARELGLLLWEGTVRSVNPGEEVPDRPGVLVVWDLLLHPEHDDQVRCIDLSGTVLLVMGMPGREYPCARWVIRTLGASSASAVSALDYLTVRQLDTDLLPDRIVAAG